MYEAVFQLIETKEDKLKVLNAISKYRSSAYMLNQKKSGGNRIDSAIDEVIGRVSDSQKETTLRELEAKVSALKILELTISYDPPAEHVSEFAGWVKKNIGSDFVLDLGVDQSILGGAKVTFDGFYTDQSLKKAFGELFLSDSVA